MSRVYTIRGKAPAARTHSRIQLSSYDPTTQYKIIEFKVVPAGNPSQTNSFGILTINEQNSLDPRDFDFAAQSQIAWSHTSVRQSVPPGIGESIQMYEQHYADYDRLFNYDIWCHTQDATGNAEINYFIKIYKQTTSKEAGAISSLMQYQAAQ